MLSLSPPLSLVVDNEHSRGRVAYIPKAKVKKPMEKSQPHVAKATGQNEWYTPPEYIAPVRKVLGDIDLDPASSEIANKIVGAKQFYTKEDNGLDKHWGGRVFMNPPYATNLIKQFVNKFVLHRERGDITSGIVLVNNATETKWFQLLLRYLDVICFPQRRLRFLDPEGNPGAPLQGQVFVYFGNNPDIFCQEFSRFGGLCLSVSRNRSSTTKLERAEPVITRTDAALNNCPAVIYSVPNASLPLPYLVSPPSVSEIERVTPSEVSMNLELNACPGCGKNIFWMSLARTGWVCESCHPPSTERFVAERKRV